MDGWVGVHELVGCGIVGVGESCPCCAFKREAYPASRTPAEHANRAPSSSQPPPLPPPCRSQQGLKSVDVIVSSACASAVDNLAAFYFRNVVQGPESGKTAAGAEVGRAVCWRGGVGGAGEPAGRSLGGGCRALNTLAACCCTALTPLPPPPQAIEAHLRQQPHLLPETLKTLFEIILFEECSNQWSLSRPMLSLILINEAVYPDLQRQVRARFWPCAAPCAVLLAVCVRRAVLRRPVFQAARRAAIPALTPSPPPPPTRARSSWASPRSARPTWPRAWRSLWRTWGATWTRRTATSSRRTSPSSGTSTGAKREAAGGWAAAAARRRVFLFLFG